MAFQATAFQNNAFQMVVAIITKALDYIPIWRRRRRH